MFGFMERRMVREQVKLIYQNRAAALRFLMFFRDTGMNQFLISDIYCSEISTFIKLMDEMEIRHSQLPIKDPQALEGLLHINKYFRKHYDDHELAMLTGSFDSVFVPLFGWRELYDRVKNTGRWPRI